MTLDESIPRRRAARRHARRISHGDAPMLGAAALDGVAVRRLTCDWPMERGA